MARFIQEGNSLDYIPSSDVAPGSIVKIGDNFFGAALRGIAANALGALLVAGVVEEAKGAGTINSGALCYWDDGNKVVTTTPADGTYLGRAVSTSSGPTVRVLLNGSNLGDLTAPSAQSEPSPTQEAIGELTAKAPAAISADVTDDTTAELIADVTAIRDEVVKLVADLATIKASVNAGKADLAALVALLVTAGILE